MDEGIKKRCYIHTLKYFAAIKNNVTSFVEKTDGTGHHVKQNKPDSEKQISNVSFHMETLHFKKRHKGTRETIWEEEGN
jgi:hypothetical protein